LIAFKRKPPVRVDENISAVPIRLDPMRRLPDSEAIPETRKEKSK
jgi:hypothetical protein